jgi:hypothetical protein
MKSGSSEAAAISGDAGFAAAGFFAAGFLAKLKILLSFERATEEEDARPPIVTPIGTETGVTQRQHAPKARICQIG